MTALSATASENATTALRAAANQEAVRTSTLDLGRLIGTFGSHDYSSIGMNLGARLRKPRRKQQGYASHTVPCQSFWKRASQIGLRKPALLFCAMPPAVPPAAPQSSRLPSYEKFDIRTQRRWICQTKTTKNRAPSRRSL